MTALINPTMPSGASGAADSQKVAVNDGSDAPRPALSPRLGRLGLVVTLGAALVVVLDFSIVNVALPSLSAELGVSTMTAQWVVTAYALTFSGLLVVGGRASDLFGKARLLVAGLVVFALASVVGGLAMDLTLLVAARAIQGMVAAVVAPAALSILTTSFPEGPARARVLGYYGMTASLGFVIGLVAGGALVETVGWRGVFLERSAVSRLGVDHARTSGVSWAQTDTNPRPSPREVLREATKRPTFDPVIGSPPSRGQTPRPWQVRETFCVVSLLRHGMSRVIGRDPTSPRAAPAKADGQPVRGGQVRLGPEH